MDQENAGRRLFQKNDLWVLLGLTAVCLAAMLFFYFRPSDGKVTAQISCEGKTVREIDLSSATDETFTLEENPGVSFEISDHQIRFINTECPDKLCENVGFISRPGQVAICLPNRVSLKIMSSGTPEIDAVVN